MTEHHDEWRVEVELDDPEHGYAVGERLRELAVDDLSRGRLGRDVAVTRAGEFLSLYADTPAGAREAERVVRQILTDEHLPAAVSLTRWHPVEQAWRPADEPLPEGPEEEALERARLLEHEREEARSRGAYDWEVRVEAPGRDEASELAHRLEGEGLDLRRRGHWVLVGALDSERADALADQIRREDPHDAHVTVEATDLPSPLFVMLGAAWDRLRGADR